MVIRGAFENNNVTKSFHNFLDLPPMMWTFLEFGIKGAAVFELASAFWLSFFLYLPNLDESFCK